MNQSDFIRLYKNGPFKNGCTVYHNDKFYALVDDEKFAVWKGRAKGPFAWCKFKSSRFTTKEDIKIWIDKMFQTETKAAAEKKAKQATMKAAKLEKLKAAKFVYRSWGYDQTNVDFYRIVEQKSKTQFVVEPVYHHRVSEDRVVPTEDVSGLQTIGRATAYGLSIDGETFRVVTPGETFYATHPYNYR